MFHALCELQINDESKLFTFPTVEISLKNYTSDIKQFSAGLRSYLVIMDETLIPKIPKFKITILLYKYEKVNIRKNLTSRNFSLCIFLWGNPYFYF